MHNLILIAALACAPHASTEAPFQDLTFEEACAKARDSERLVFIDFYTTWCGPCKKLDAVTWKDATVIDWLDKHTVALKVDAEKQVKLARRFKVRAYPSLLFINPSGELKGSILGFRKPQDFLKEARGVLDGVKRLSRLRDSLAKDPSNPMAKMDLARELVREEQHAEALELFLWCFDQGDEDPKYGFGGVRVSFLLRDLTRLSRVYPAALEALHERRDKAKEILLGPSPEPRAATDFTVINRSLEDQALTLEVYDALTKKAQETLDGAARQESPAFDPRPELFEEIVPLLMKAKRYQDVVDGYGDPLTWYRGRLERTKILASASGDESNLSSYRLQLTTKAGLVYEALLGANKYDDQASKLAAALVEQAPSPATWNALMRAAHKAGRKDVQLTLYEAALETLPKSKHRRLWKVRK